MLLSIHGQDVRFQTLENVRHLLVGDEVCVCVHASMHAIYLHHVLQCLVDRQVTHSVRSGVISSFGFPRCNQRILFDCCGATHPAISL